jgi:hypothetical protein
MDLRIYYEQVRAVEAEIAGPYAVIVSKGTPDGGKEGTRTEVSRRLAAKMVVEGLARLATPEETSEFQESLAEAARRAEEARLASRLQVSVVSMRDLQELRQQTKG